MYMCLSSIHIRSIEFPHLYYHFRTIYVNSVFTTSCYQQLKSQYPRGSVSNLNSYHACSPWCRKKSCFKRSFNTHCRGFVLCDSFHQRCVKRHENIQDWRHIAWGLLWGVTGLHVLAVSTPLPSKALFTTTGLSRSMLIIHKQWCLIQHHVTLDFVADIRMNLLWNFTLCVIKCLKLFVVHSCFNKLLIIVYIDMVH